MISNKIIITVEYDPNMTQSNYEWSRKMNFSDLNLRDKSIWQTISLETKSTWNYTYPPIEIIQIIVLKTGPMIDSAGVLDHWVIGRTIESVVKPND